MLDLSIEEQALLADLVEQAYRDLKTEIYHTEDEDFKAGLKTRETLMLGLLDKLGRPMRGTEAA